MVGAAGRSPCSSRVPGVVTTSRSGQAAPMSGEASRRSSPSATALTPIAHPGRAVHLAEAKCRTKSADALVGAPSQSQSRWLWSPAPPGARRSMGAPVQRPSTACGSTAGKRRGLKRGLSHVSEASVRRRCAAPGRTRSRGRGGMAVRARAAQARMRRAAMRDAGYGAKGGRRSSPKREPPPTGEAA